MHLNKRILSRLNTACCHWRNTISQTSQRNTKTFLISQTIRIDQQRFKHHKELKAYHSESLSFVKSASEEENVDWPAIRENCINSSFNITNDNVDAIILQHFMTDRLHDLCRKFIEYLKLQPLDELKLGTIGKLFKFYGTISFENQVTDADVKHIYKIHEHIQKKYKVLDFNTLEYYMQAIACTPKWRSYTEILDKYNSSLIPNLYSNNAIIAAAFRNGDNHFGWKLLNQVPKENRFASSYVYLAWIETCVKNYKGPELLSNLDKIMTYAYNNRIMLEEIVVKTLHQVLSRELSWEGTFLKIDERSTCSNCKSKLEPNLLTDDEYNELRSVFFEKSLVGRNPFLKTSPTELSEFLNYLNRHAPFDIVVDALNVAYTKRGGFFGGNAENIVSVVKHLLTNNKKILVLGKKYMNKWDRKHIEFLKDNTYMFLTENLSYDDPFLLYAALSSSKTNFVSRDKMKSHSFLLETPELQRLFVKWQISHQCFVINITKYGRVEMKLPMTHFLLPQKQGQIWHVPYKIKLEEEEMNIFNYFNDVYWLCIQPPLVTNDK